MTVQFKLTAVAALLTLVGCSQQNTNTQAAVQNTFNDLNKNGQLEPYEDPKLTEDQRLQDLLTRLTLDEKLLLVTGTGIDASDFGGSNRVQGAAGSTHAIDRFGIPALALADGPAGLRIAPKRPGSEDTFFATAFPVATTLASSWDTQLMNEVGQAMGAEVKEYGVDLFLAPGMNLHYNPLGGRNFEYYSEDPLLSGKMAAAAVNGVESHNVGATIKHFAVNNAETSRMLLDAVVSERALREIYLRSFEIAVKEAKPWAVMTAYNKVNGTYTSQDPALLTHLLRDEWGFDGVVMTDWFAGTSPRAQMQAGNELIMPGRPQDRDDIKLALDNGELSIEQLDRNVKNILRVVFKSPVFNGYNYTNKPDLLKHATIVRTAAAEGTVLLKNENNTLPLSANGVKIAAFGNASYDFISGGTGSGDVNEAYTVSLVEGFQNNNIKADPTLLEMYQQHIKVERARQPEKKFFFESLPPLAELELSRELIKQKALETDVAIITVGRNSGEFQDRKVAGDFDLTDIEKNLINTVSEEFRALGKRVVVILNIGNVIETASWRDKADAIILPWQGGQEAGNAAVDVLIGKVNPSGKLPTTFPINYTDVPSATFFPGEALSDEMIVDAYSNMPLGKISRLKYSDGIYVGYRYYEGFKIDTSYPFGFGLSYTNFTYSNPSLIVDKVTGEITLKTSVKNTGDQAGKEVVQLYISAPTQTMDKPVKELKGFIKTKLLKPGETEQITFNVSAEQLASFSSTEGGWIAEAGSYKIMLAASSADIRTSSDFKLESAFFTPVSTRFKPLEILSELKRD
jgi:beta-glucosidase